jgi:hypothetical protein
MRNRIGIVLAAGGSLGLILAIVLVTGVMRSGGSARCSIVAGPRNGSPLFGGRITTVAGAQEAAGFPVLVPDVQAARLANLTHTWVNDQGYVALVFAAGKVTITLAPAIYSNALSDYQRFIAQTNAAATIVYVHGQPALVITPHTDACGTNPAWIELDRRGTDINIYSSSYGTDALLPVAGSLMQRVP